MARQTATRSTPLDVSQPCAPLAVRRHDVARISAWTVSLEDMVPLHGELERDIEDLFTAGKMNHASYGLQTATLLQDLPGLHWKHFFGAIRDALAAVVAEASGPIDSSRVHLRAWASKLGPDLAYDKQSLQLSVLHNHSPAFMSVVYYLRIPREIEGPRGGTMIVNPLPHSLGKANPGVIVPGREGTATIFPSYLLHAPSTHDFSAVSSNRTVIAVDAHFVPE